MTSISVFNGKGGVGKTTLSTVIGVELGAHWIDADPQGSLAIWGARRDAVVHEATGAAVPPLLATLSGAVVIDTPGALVAAADPVLSAVSLTVIPTSLRQADLDSLGSAVGLVRDLGVPAVLLLTRVHPRTKVEAVSNLFDGLGLPLCPFRLAERVAYDQAFCAGRTAAELDPDGPAAVESRQVADWVLNHAS